MSNMMQIIVLATILGYASAVNQAVVFLQGTDITGNVTFTQETDGVSVEGRIVGLTKGDHGFHVHEKGDLTGGCATAGPHFNPGNKVHGGPSDSERHIGDLGNVNAQADGVATFKFSDSLISLTGANSIVGRAVVVHSDPDDFGKGGFPDSNTTGHSGTRVACGVIGIVELDNSSSSLAISTMLLLLTSILLSALNIQW